MKRLWLRLICAVLVLITLAGCAAAEGASATFFSILLMGIDEKGIQEGTEQAQGRADAIIVAVISSEGGFRLASVERDLCVTRPEEYGASAGDTKLCITSYVGGLALTLAKTNEALGLAIPYYAAIDKEGVVKMINAMGGLTIEITDEDLAVAAVKKAFRKGERKLNGKGVLAYIGKRDEDLAGDIDRNRRQRKVISAVFDKLKEMGSDQMIKLLTEGMEVVQTNLDFSGVLSIAGMALGAGLTRPEETRYPQQYTREIRNLHNVVLPTDSVAEQAALWNFLYGTRDE